VDVIVGGVDVAIRKIHREYARLPKGSLARFAHPPSKICCVVELGEEVEDIFLIVTFVSILVLV